MKLWLWLALLLLPCAMHAQVVGPGFINYVTSAPSGACSQGEQMRVVIGLGTVYTCQSGTWTQVGGGGGAVAFSAITSGTNITSAMVVGAGASLVSVPEFDIGASGTAGVLGLIGSTSGTAKCTAPAIAGIVTNPVTCTNVFLGPAGGATTATYAVSTAGNGLYLAFSNAPAITTNGVPTVVFNSNSIVEMGTSNGIGWTNNNSAASGTVDASISHPSAGIVSIDTTAIQNGLGTIRPGKYATTVNCSNAAAPAVCAAAAAGVVAVPTGVNPTLTINTTAVTAVSQIFVEIDESATIAATTCNTTLNTLTQPVVTARVAATSFTIQIGATIATNPACVSYFIVN